MDKESHEFNELMEICRKLRSKTGCLWDRQQTHKSLIPYLEEESGEVKEAILKGSDENLKEELGDLLFQVIFHSCISEERGAFGIFDVMAAIKEKLIRRHPHVFGDIKADSVEKIIENWEKIKEQEKKN